MASFNQDTAQLPHPWKVRGQSRVPEGLQGIFLEPRILLAAHTDPVSTLQQEASRGWLGKDQEGGGIAHQLLCEGQEVLLYWLPRCVLWQMFVTVASH